MTRPPLKDVGASVRKRLTDTARQRDENAQLLMLRFAIERLIFRLSQSVYREQFILKGAMLFSLWAPVPYRSTGDLDLLGQGYPTPARIAAIFKTLCDLTVQDDGVVYDGESVRAESTREDEDYRGVRVTLTATLAKPVWRCKSISALATPLHRPPSRSSILPCSTSNRPASKPIRRKP